MTLNKVVRNGKVAVLYSPSFGAGWFTWNREYPEVIFHPVLVALVEEGRQSEIDEDLIRELLGKKDIYFYDGGSGDLEIEWLDEGTEFQITEYDGSGS